MMNAELGALCARARKTFPDFALPDETFVRHLANCAAANRQDVARLASLAIEDLFLACACAAGDLNAIAQFENVCAAAIRTAIATVTATRVERDEVEQQLRTDLLVGRAGAPPKIAAYGGRAPLSRWVGVAARRLAISMARATGAEARARERAAFDHHVGWCDPAVALAKQRYRDDFRWALEQAIAHLGKREQMLLRLHLVAGATTRRIATMYAVSQPTASRWLEEARRDIVDEVRRLLGERLGLRPGDLDSLAAVLLSDVDVSLCRLLGAD